MLVQPQQLGGLQSCDRCDADLCSTCHTVCSTFLEVMTDSVGTDNEEAARQAQPDDKGKGKYKRQYAWGHPTPSKRYG